MKEAVYETKIMRANGGVSILFEDAACTVVLPSDLLAHRESRKTNISLHMRVLGFREFRQVKCDLPNCLVWNMPQVSPTFDYHTSGHILFDI